MSRRVRLPGADDLFRPTAEDTEAPVEPGPTAAPQKETGTAAASGRIKHDEKITVYVTHEELMAVEQARLALRAQHGVSADRGRLVRTAIALALADLEEHGDDSRLVRRLAES